MRALLAAFLLSCGDGEIYWSLPAEMTAEERATFADACARWSAVAHRQQRIGEGDRRVVLMPRGAMQNAGANGETSDTEMRLAADLPAEQFPLTVTHELGHALGLGHHSAPGVMHSPATQQDINEADLAECRRVGACP